MEELQQRLLTTAEAADWYRVHPATIRRWIRNHDVTAVTIGNGRRRTLRVVADLEIERVSADVLEQPGRQRVAEASTPATSESPLAPERRRAAHASLRAAGGADSVPAPTDVEAEGRR
jgi:excisionase family DNA binding protein